MSYLIAAILLAEEPNRGPDYGKASPVGLLVVLLLLVAVLFLWRSMRRQLKKVPASFDSPAADDSGPTVSGPDVSGPGAAESTPAVEAGPGGPESEAGRRGAGG